MRILKNHPIVLLTLVAVFVVATTVPSAYAYKYNMTSGVFSLPSDATQINVKILNRSAQNLTVFLEVRVFGASGSWNHSDTAVRTIGPEQFLSYFGTREGYGYEILVLADDLSILPTVAGCDSLGNTIAGTTILPADFIIHESPKVVEVILDNLPAGQKDGARTFIGMWCKSTAAGYYGTDSLYSCGSSIDTYILTPTLSVAGTYNVYVRWTAFSNRSTAVPISVNHTGGLTTKTFNQQTNGGKWVLYGAYNFDEGTGGFVTISDINGQACADAVRFELVP